MVFHPKGFSLGASDGLKKTITKTKCPVRRINLQLIFSGEITIPVYIIHQ
jgi:hypothetical protein